MWCLFIPCFLWRSLGKTPLCFQPPSLLTLIPCGSPAISNRVTKSVVYWYRHTGDKVLRKYRSKLGELRPINHSSSYCLTAQPMLTKHRYVILSLSPVGHEILHTTHKQMVFFQSAITHRLSLFA